MTLRAGGQIVGHMSISCCLLTQGLLACVLALPCFDTWLPLRLAWEDLSSHLNLELDFHFHLALCESHPCLSCHTWSDASQHHSFKLSSTLDLTFFSLLLTMFDPPAGQLQLQLQRENAPRCSLKLRAASATQVIHLSSAVRHLWPHKRRWPGKRF